MTLAEISSPLLDVQGGEIQKALWGFWTSAASKSSAPIPPKSSLPLCSACSGCTSKRQAKRPCQRQPRYKFVIQKDWYVLHTSTRDFFCASSSKPSWKYINWMHHFWYWSDSMLKIDMSSCADGKTACGEKGNACLAISATESDQPCSKHARSWRSHTAYQSSPY